MSGKGRLLSALQHHAGGLIPGHAAVLNYHGQSMDAIPGRLRVQDASAVRSGAEGYALSRSPYMLAGKLVAASAPFMRSTALSYACRGRGVLTLQLSARLHRMALCMIRKALEKQGDTDTALQRFKTQLWLLRWPSNT